MHYTDICYPIYLTHIHAKWLHILQHQTQTLPSEGKQYDEPFSKLLFRKIRFSMYRSGKLLKKNKQIL